MANPFPHPFVKVKYTTINGVQVSEYVESVVYNKKTGERKLKFPVDARELVKTGEWQETPPELPEVQGESPEPEPPAAPMAAEPTNIEPRRGPGRPRKVS